MSLTVQQIRLLAPFFTDDQLVEQWGADQTQITAAFNGNRPVADVRATLPFLERHTQAIALMKETLQGLPDGGFNEAAVLNLCRRIDALDISVRLTNVLVNSDCEYLWQAVLKSESQLLKTKNMGRKALNEFKEFLDGLNLSIGMHPYTADILEARRRTGHA